MTKENEIIIFETENKIISLLVMVENESVWLDRGQMAELFKRDIKTIGKHINNALKEELSEQNSVVAKFATVKEYPNPQLGWGVLCLRDSLPE